ncbi:uncharacterized protein (DUF305 family) [Microbacterium sp. SORGH_AS428]|uniref:DUF305 domain-containing protein n=1 Tax=Microbacterium sp. SORGH_AS_0428 TaxID=3041788 RepID=UPI002862B747|nr:DUF305 domain-containing protein [Microbacterium sp. SORGH_AS_0428]MDR6200651.1 uncharacterized protein (DUF305 family) [Microbacterium sp. SORGH_AS_0428]
MTERTERRPGRWIAAGLVALAVVAVGFAIGRFSLFDNAPAVPNAADIGFARDMQVHHDQAVEMAMIAYQGTQDDTVRALSYDIATGQAAQNGMMFEWLTQWGVPQQGTLMSWMGDTDAHGSHGAGADADPAELRASMGMATDAELAELRSASGTALDCQFLTLMIRHHEGAIPMAEAVLERGSIPRVLQVAETMKTNQTAEIDAMRASQARLGCAAG